MTELIEQLRSAKRWLDEHGRNTNTGIGVICSDAADAIEQLEKQVPKWIPVTERLPDLELAEAKANDADFYPCLVVIKHPKAKGGRYVSKCWYNGYQ